MLSNQSSRNLKIKVKKKQETPLEKYFRKNTNANNLGESPLHSTFS